MKKAICIILILFASMVVIANAETDVSTMTDEELYALRLQINNELASRIETTDITEYATIAELFPDPVLAKYIRDEVGAFSTKDHVSQEKLDSVTSIMFLNSDYGIKSLEGIQYLHNMDSIYIHNQKSITEIPQYIGNLSNLEYIMFSGCSISSLPDSICNLTLLRELDISYNPIIALPEDIGNLTLLVELNISKTNITSLPQSIYNLALEKFEREGLDFD